MSKLFIFVQCLLLLLVVKESYAAIYYPSNPRSEDFPPGGSVRFDVYKEEMLLPSELYTTVLTDRNVTMFTGSTEVAPALGIAGELVPFSPLDGCQPLGRDGQKRLKTVGTILQDAIVLIERGGGCSLETKLVHAAQVPNVIGALVFGEEGNPTPVGGYLPLRTVNKTVPGFLISRALGLDLVRRVEKYRSQKQRRWVRVTLRYVGKPSPLMNVLQFVMAAAVLLLALSFIVSLMWNRRTRREAERRVAEASRGRTDQLIGQIEIDEVFLSKLPIRNYPTKSVVIKVEAAAVEAVEELQVPPNETCPICLDEFEPSESLNHLACGHWYHIGCIQPWLQHRSPCCPLCKVDVREAYVSEPKEIIEEKPAPVSRFAWNRLFQRPRSNPEPIMMQEATTTESTLDTTAWHEIALDPTTEHHS